ncbi:hypothetical protein MPTK1_5g10630 [Marchantia polymorpha subsp. ruderalis]|uniref:Uncharacterized protein n=2 Tax=Marchantia polymorpha TaxID=3197 RepID=A0AAF6BH06_MARPO|nr:hypothetical protein MARPO_0048s0009 [Marchantia polymorpha]BBN11290.1 hypothetical protein Mp_5g10630 [Marchantia polymorpha subsp. ruderalis]|eukprot:PTQ38881.1 hypothetical protein MARPO_0048s0009 [Marchantia polymorpha]
MVELFDNFSKSDADKPTPRPISSPRFYSAMVKLEQAAFAARAMASLPVHYLGPIDRSNDALHDCSRKIAAFKFASPARELLPTPVLSSGQLLHSPCSPMLSRPLVSLVVHGQTPCIGRPTYSRLIQR